ncbi:MAG: hypothetical protein P8Y97_13950 [Candidatus Lokiarchaeota archaeon]
MFKKTIPKLASALANVHRIAFSPARDRIIKPSIPSIRILFSSPRASSSTALSETLNIAADIAETMPSLTPRARTETIGNPCTETIAAPCTSEFTADKFFNKSVSSLIFSDMCKSI